MRLRSTCAPARTLRCDTSGRTQARRKYGLSISATTSATRAMLLAYWAMWPAAEPRPRRLATLENSSVRLKARSMAPALGREASTVSFLSAASRFSVVTTASVPAIRGGGAARRIAARRSVSIRRSASMATKEGLIDWSGVCRFSRTSSMTVVSTASAMASRSVSVASSLAARSSTCRWS